MNAFSSAFPFSVSGRYSGRMILLDGKALAQKILTELKEEIVRIGKTLRLAVVVVGDDPVTRRFIEQKKKAAQLIGVEVSIHPFEMTVTKKALRESLAEIVHEERNTGVIVQIPLPKEINTQYIVDAIVLKKDVDVLSAEALGDFAAGKENVMPPVVAAIKTLLDAYEIEYRKKHFVLLGAGRLVGKPMAYWLLRQQATFSAITEETLNPAEILKMGDIVVAGIPGSHYVTGDMVKEGVIVIDAGTSEAGGKETGNVDFESVAPKASFLTPVPGGVGPLTVAMLFKNLLTLAKQRL